VAPGPVNFTLEFSYPIDHLEAGALKLSSEHFPLPCSLATLVQQRFADPARSDDSQQAMSKRELLEYL